MTRAERAAEVARLLADGLNGIQIAERLGISRSYAYGLIGDPDGSADKERKASYGRPCIEGCGRTTDGSNGRTGAPLRCIECQQHKNDERNARIFEAWERGDTAGAIGAREGMVEGAVANLVDHHRRNGIDLKLHRRRNRELWPLIELRRSEGATFRQIAAETGTTPENIGYMAKQMRNAGIAVPNPNNRGGPRMANYSAQSAIDRDIEKTEERIAALETELAERRAYMEALKAARDAMASKLRPVAA